VPDYPAIPDPTTDIQNLAEVARALKEAVEVLVGQRGSGDGRALLQSEAALITSQSSATSGRADIADTLDPAYLDAILDRAAEAAENLTEEARRDASTALTELRVTLENIKNGIDDDYATIESQLNELTATVRGNTATISEESVVRVTEISALAGQIESLTATVNDNTASISDEAVTRADEDTAISATISTLSATVSANTAAITSEATTRANNDSALTTAINNLSSTVSTNTSNISSISTAYASADTALSNRIDTVEAMTEAGTADGYYRLTAVSSPADGAAAEFAVEVKAGSSSSFSTAGMRLQAFSNGTSRVKFLVDQFIVADSSGTYVPFTITSGDLIANAITSASNVDGLGALGLIDKLTSANLATYMDTGVIGTAYIGDAQITSAKIDSVDANKINATTLSAITANLGTVTTGRIQNTAGSIDINLASNYVDILATGFKLRDSTSNSGVAPFYVESGVTYIEAAKIKRGVVSQLATASVTSSSYSYPATTFSASVTLTLRAGASVTLIGVYNAPRNTDVGSYNATLALKRSSTTLQSLAGLKTQNTWYDSIDETQYTEWQPIDSTLLATYTALSDGSNTFHMEISGNQYAMSAWAPDNMSIMVVEYNK
jgi:hypothetical protein